MSNEMLNPEFDFPFIDKVTGEKVVIRAHDVELATLRAWAKNPNLRFDVSEVKNDG